MRGQQHEHRRPDRTASSPTGSAEHWDGAYNNRGVHGVSWFQERSVMSLELIATLGLDPADAIIDVGGGASVLVSELSALGYRDLTVLDISAEALTAARHHLDHHHIGGHHRGATRGAVDWVRTNVLDWVPPRRYRLWHDRAVFHFLADPTQQDLYRAKATAAVTPGGFLIVGTFAADGPEFCSGLPVARYTPDRLARALQPGFASIATYCELHQTPAGATQPFTWQILRRVENPTRR